MPKKTKSKTSVKKKSSAAAGAKQRLHPDHTQKILSLHPKILEAVHNILKTSGVDAVVHRISFIPPGTRGEHEDDCPCTPPQRSCFVDGVWTVCSD